MARQRKVFSSADYIVFVFFVVSLVNSITVYVFYFALLIFLGERTKGGVKALFWLTVRGLLSTAVGASIGGAAMLKWVLLLGFSVWIILFSRPDDREKHILNKVTVSGAVFALYAVLSSMLFSSFPVVSVFKVIAFYLPMIAILRGIAATVETEDWTEYYFRIFAVLFLICFFTIPFGRFRIVNSDFQGVFNHVSVLGILSALFVAITVNRKEIYKMRMQHIIIAAVIVMVYLSRSRTGMLSVIGVLMTWRFMDSNHKKNSTFFMLLLSVVMVLVLLAFPAAFGSATSMAREFMLKGQTSENIFVSRMEQVSDAMIKFNAHPFFGSGFMTPFFPGFRSSELRFDLIVEPGNLIYAVLGDTGIIGTFLFAIFLLQVFTVGNKQKLSLFVGALMINMGEMVFFSANNMSILVYYLLGAFIFSDRQIDELGLNMSN